MVFRVFAIHNLNKGKVSKLGDSSFRLFGCYIIVLTDTYSPRQCFLLSVWKNTMFSFAFLFKVETWK